MRRSANWLARFVGRRSGDSAARTHETAARREAGEAPDLPAGRYDTLTVDEVLSHLPELAPVDLATLGEHERTHQNRLLVLAHVDARLGNEPWPGYDALDVDGVRFGLEGARRDRFVMVLAYEQAHRNRAGVVLAAQQKARRGGT